MQGKDKFIIDGKVFCNYKTYDCSYTKEPISETKREIAKEILLKVADIGDTMSGNAQANFLWHLCKIASEYGLNGRNLFYGRDEE